MVCRLFCCRLPRQDVAAVVQGRVEERRTEAIERASAQVVLFFGVWVLGVRGLWVVEVLSLREQQQR